MKRTSEGFTIIELLIVIVIIAILATITLVAYNGIQNRAYDSAVESDLNNIAKKLELYNVDNSVYPNNTTQLTSAALKVSGGSYSTAILRNLVYCYNSTNNAYTLSVTSKSGTQFYATSVNGSSVRPYPGTWTTGTGAQAICDNAASGYTYVNMGYYYNSTPPWSTWTNYSS